VGRGPSAGGCARFDGRGLSIRLEVGWTLRPTFMLLLVERGTVVNFADQTAALIGGFTLDAAAHVARGCVGAKTSTSPVTRVRSCLHRGSRPRTSDTIPT
jgi:hypothetical protein